MLGAICNCHICVGVPQIYLNQDTERAWVHYCTFLPNHILSVYQIYYQPEISLLYFYWGPLFIDIESTVKVFFFFPWVQHVSLCLEIACKHYSYLAFQILAHIQLLIKLCHSIPTQSITLHTSLILLGQSLKTNVADTKCHLLV